MDGCTKGMLLRGGGKNTQDQITMTYTARKNEGSVLCPTLKIVKTFEDTTLEI